MATPNYSYEKRQKELARKRKQEEKRQKKLHRHDGDPAAGTAAADDVDAPSPGAARPDDTPAGP